MWRSFVSGDETYYMMDGTIRTIERAMCATAPAYLASRLGLKYEPFHERWFDHQRQHRRTLVLAPRFHGKSVICNEVFTVWKILRDPSRRVLIVSDTFKQAIAFGGNIRKHLESEYITDIYGVQMGDKWTEDQFTIAGRDRLQKASKMKREREATVTCMGVLGPIISRHYDIILLDDIVTLQNAAMPSRRDRVVEWYRKALLPNLNPIDGEIHVLGTRYHPEEFYGKIIQNERAAWRNQGTRFFRPLITRAIGHDGDALWPEGGWDIDTLEVYKREMTSAFFSLQFQNDARLAAGAYFKPEWIKKYDEPPKRHIMVWGVDPQRSTKDTADYFAMVGVLATPQGDYYVLPRIIRDRPTFAQKTQIVVAIAKAYEPEKILVECAGGDEHFKQHLVDTAPFHHIRGYHPGKNDKAMRFSMLQGLMEHGKIHFPRGNDDAEKLISEMLSFPGGEHDDMIDALQMAIFGARNMLLSLGGQGHVPREVKTIVGNIWGKEY